MQSDLCTYFEYSSQADSLCMIKKPKADLAKLHVQTIQLFILSWELSSSIASFQCIPQFWSFLLLLFKKGMSKEWKWTTTQWGRPESKTNKLMAVLKTVCSTQSWVIPNTYLASYEIPGPCSVPYIKCSKGTTKDPKFHRCHCMYCNYFYAHQV